ncbi:hypothetical protein PAXRUDRAFT_447602 [Paxillus rubicundulus Ve08.2h10]|uniref:Uncharacterized protein n=1 Tax=Paxillus rubicundulus Ve08.2h10 TaxID=930991 RepID=A0A0D0E206_9AGAM|nr:hypothetical protein PAXRUDRAFT_447602 [Paxillus rubicundulus Ve08.2h10]
MNACSSVQHSDAVTIHLVLNRITSESDWSPAQTKPRYSQVWLRWKVLVQCRTDASLCGAFLLHKLTSAATVERTKSNVSSATLATCEPQTARSSFCLGHPARCLTDLWIWSGC